MKKHDDHITTPARGKKKLWRRSILPEQSLIFVESPDPCPEQILFYFPRFLSKKSSVGKIMQHHAHFTDNLGIIN